MRTSYLVELVKGFSPTKIHTKFIFESESVTYEILPNNTEFILGYIYCPSWDNSEKICFVSNLFSHFFNESHLSIIVARYIKLQFHSVSALKYQLTGENQN